MLFINVFALVEKRTSVKQEGLANKNTNKNSELAKHLARNNEHEFSCCVLTKALENTLKRRILEA